MSKQSEAPCPQWRQPPKWGPRQQTRERLRIIRRNLHKTDEEIGRIFGISRAAVHALRVRYGIAKKRGDTQRRDHFIGLIRKMRPGLTPEVMALKLGLREGTARYYAQLAGYAFPHKSERWKEKIKSLPPALTLGNVAGCLGVSYGHGLRLCQKYCYKVTYTGSSRPPRLPIRRKTTANNQ